MVVVSRHALVGGAPTATGVPTELLQWHHQGGGEEQEREPAAAGDLHL